MAEIKKEGELLTAKLFPSTLFCTNLNTDNVQNLLSNVKNLKFFGHKNSNYGGTEKNILDEFVTEKQIFTDKINSVFNKFYDNKFKITTSWFTVTKSGGSGNWHKHSHCWYSGVYYFQDFTSELVLRNPIERDIEMFNNEINSPLWMFEPKKGDLLLFPSYLYHMVNTNTSNTDRNSLAFNIMPDGEVGFGDSKYEY
jgi:uncharacterized protein (TIGR02466 family)